MGGPQRFFFLPLQGSDSQGSIIIEAGHYCGGNKKSFLKCVKSKRKTSNNIDLFLDEDGPSQIGMQTKQSHLNAFFTFAFNINDGLWDPWHPEMEDRDSRNGKLPANAELL